MTRRPAMVAAGLLVMFALVACTTAATTVSQPSLACGGFHLRVINGLSESVKLTIGSDWQDVVEAGQTQTVIEFLAQPDLPHLPWLVEIYDATGRVSLFRQTMDGAVDQKVTLNEGTAVAAPLQSCGQGLVVR